ncbi:MAG: AAA family ATPase [Planctomycetaceae bacterium]|nr:AAA family ATPase [Planctomycetales bacterium]MCB9923686.1 AAA family ATPase [Planctomycetaceae bacterium]
MVTETLEIEGDLLATLLAEDAFLPVEPRTLKETGLPIAFVEGLILKSIAVTGTSSGRNISDHLCLPFGILEEVFGSLRTRQLLVHTGSAPFGDYYYTLTDQGNKQAQSAVKACAYVGPAPVPLMDYVISVDAQSITAESPRREELEHAFHGITIDPELFDMLGPAVNSGAGMFLYGSPGNGKSTLAQRMTACFGQEIWIPHAIIDGGQIIKLYDPSYHQAVEGRKRGIVKSSEGDRRWIKVRRPTVIVGGELTMDSLDIRYDARTNISEAPLQLKSNGGCLLIDDFGRQQIAPKELLNRWIIPLESRHDFLTLGTGKKIQVPFDQLIIFSTNLEPSELVDEAFMRRIPYKIEVGDPDEQEFEALFKMYADEFGCIYNPDAVAYLLATHYRPSGRGLRRCHPRDLMKQIRSYCAYHDLPLELKPEYFDRVVGTYFAKVLNS